MAKGGGSQTVTTKLDPQAMKFRQGVYDKATDVAGQAYQGYGGPRVAMPNAQFQQGVGLLTGAPAGYEAAQYGLAQNLGFGTDAIRQAMGMNFDPATAQQYLNPYQQQVINTTQGDFDRQKQMAMGMVDAQAAKTMGAFGGARHGLATGQALGDVGRAEASTLAGLRQSGFNDSYNRFSQDRSMLAGMGGQLANLGLTGWGNLDALRQQQGQAGVAAGDYQRNLQQQQYDAQYKDFLEKRGWGAQQLGLLQGAMGMPTGSTQTGPGQQSNPFGSALGGASIGANFGPAGALIGGGLGFLGGLF